jgi:hypothetical protein
MIAARRVQVPLFDDVSHFPSSSGEAAVASTTLLTVKVGAAAAFGKVSAPVDPSSIIVISPAKSRLLFIKKCPLNYPRFFTAV